MAEPKVDNIEQLAREITASTPLEVGGLRAFTAELRELRAREPKTFARLFGLNSAPVTPK